MDVDPCYRLRGALLAGVGVVALVVGGWWWRAEAPAPAPTGVGVASDGSLLATYWQEDPVSGTMFRQDPGASSLVLDSATGAVLVDPRTGAVLQSAGAGGDAARGAGREGSRRDVVWTERASLSEGTAVVRAARIGRDERHLLMFSCTGPGELLVTVVGARAADPLTVGCDGAVTTTEMTGSGAPVQVSFSTAGSAPLQLVARLVARS
ncbi:hypothetical protein E0H26_06100 [Micromonospora zingiberis]|uniref:Uncharacterized protein n=1 Tax=Micromonospora zingiberis TaxID=2053011 RepID=A0A4R0GTH3_9ACTN|nr:hypothetical protein [Micromonospora zingiberis]TCB98981.1 hypothetical protein E0H26_06100 [Micromonospora zingiberis]